MPSKKRILIVDDDPRILTLLRAILKKAKYEILEALSADSALEILEHEDVDLIISDITMPGMSGLEFLDEVRQWDMDLPVVFVSGQDSSRERAKKIIGASAVVEKPFKKEVLLKTVKRAISHGSTPPTTSAELEQIENLEALDY